jgi:hypothetical protein
LICYAAPVSFDPRPREGATSRNARKDRRRDELTLDELERIGI